MANTPLTFTLVIHGAPVSSQAPATALRFAEAAVAAGHRIARVFFYRDAVHTATALAAPAQDEADLPGQWQQWLTAHQVDAVVCVAAALRRGVINSAEAERWEKPGDNLASGYDLSGLGQLVSAAIGSDRVITFGA